jgi:YD repeat-containing protein
MMKVEAKEGNYKFDYDKLNQLVKADTPFANLEYKYDEIGNRISLIQDGMQINYQINELNQATQAGNVKYKYDKNGNLIEKEEAAR